MRDTAVTSTQLTVSTRHKKSRKKLVPKIGAIEISNMFEIAIEELAGMTATKARAYHECVSKNMDNEAKVLRKELNDMHKLRLRLYKGDRTALAKIQ